MNEAIERARNAALAKLEEEARCPQYGAHEQPDALAALVELQQWHLAEADHLLTKDERDYPPTAPVEEWEQDWALCGWHNRAAAVLELAYSLLARTR
jgi:hypothetical protein